jgi:alpha-L-fucosidase
MKKIIFLILVAGLFSNAIYSQSIQNFNKPERIKWFEDLAFGMFIHWNVDVSLGAVISHSLAGASDEYVQKYISELPRFFNPQKFQSG